MPVPPVAHLRFAYDGAALRAEPHAFRVELRSDPKGGVALPGYFPRNSSTTASNQLGIPGMCRRSALDGAPAAGAHLALVRRCSARVRLAGRPFDISTGRR